MKLLLLLSALLAALSGAGAGVRAPQAHAVQRAVQAAQPQVRRAHAHVLAAARPSGVVTAEPAPLPASFTPARPRLWTLRRRE